MTHKWHYRYLDLARHVATWSKDPSTKVGAVIVDQLARPVSFGFNGLPRGVLDSPDRLNVRETKYKMIVHGERNAILFAGRSVAGCTLYTVPFMPCAQCAGMIIQAGITRVVAPRFDSERWAEDFKLTEQMFAEAGVELILFDTLEN